MKNNLIVGAGITGLTIAQNLPNSTVVEKSKGLGGRLATRRWQNQKFDHGAQFYKLTPDSETFHQLWQSHDLVKSLLDTKWCTTSGMSSLAKKLAENLKVQLEKQVTKIVNTHEVHFTDGTSAIYDQIFFTCPLPQTLKILDDSNIQYPDRLKKIIYAKALVFLLSTEDVISSPYSSPYVENPTPEIFSITDQNWKTGAPGTAWTLTMNPAWSEKHFDQSDGEITAQFKKIFSTHDMKLQLKKWRYSHPLSQDAELFVKLGNLYLAGDAFGGASINGALRSAAGIVASV
jgi:renalase